ncbi:hypothetical protein V5799_034419 [Amblyomma americanum]|uniref:Uncharacterized protein n=1 Tax=Amblyomma americanum TaxID=6943 RepID=A0AAQ4DKI2_AMBAM
MWLSVTQKYQFDRYVGRSDGQSQYAGGYFIMRHFKGGGRSRGCLGSEQRPKPNNILHYLFAKLLYDGYPLDSVYFAYPPEGEPKGATLYRFILTNGTFLNVREKLKPKHHPELHT